MINPAAWTSIIKHLGRVLALSSIIENVDQLVSLDKSHLFYVQGNK